MPEAVPAKGKSAAPHKTPPRDTRPTEETGPRLSVRYYRRMRLHRVYPMKISWYDSSRPTGPAAAPVVLRPLIPGALVVPAERTLDPNRPDDQAVFSVTPLALGRLSPAGVEVVQNGRPLQMMPLPARAVRQRLTWILLFLTFLVPAFVLYTTRYLQLSGTGPLPEGQRSGGRAGARPGALVPARIGGGPAGRKPVPNEGKPARKPGAEDEKKPADGEEQVAKVDDEAGPAGKADEGDKKPADKPAGKADEEPGAAKPATKPAGPGGGIRPGSRLDREGKPPLGLPAAQPGDPARGGLNTPPETGGDTKRSARGPLESFIVENVPPMKIDLDSPVAIHVDLVGEAASGTQFAYEIARNLGKEFLSFRIGVALLALTCLSWFLHTGLRKRRVSKPLVLSRAAPEPSPAVMARRSEPVITVEPI
jgi:hypothetical protein